MPTDEWIKDVNLWIVGNGDRHWDRGDANGDIPNNRLNSLIHSMYRLNLSHNLLIHLFRSKSDSTKKLTFDNYYNGKIHEVLEFFADRVAEMPYRSSDHDEKDYVSKNKLEAFEEDLREASEYAKSNAPGLEMRLLYERENVNGSQKTLQKVRGILLRSRKNIRWICMPFLKFSDPKIPTPPQRPIPADIDLHLKGNITDSSVPIAQRQIGVKDLDYLDFLFYSPSSQDEAHWLHNARTFAMAKELFDSEDVITRERRESGYTQDVKGGGNGYRCDTSTGQRKCVVAPATEYCVNNNTNYCP